MALDADICTAAVHRTGSGVFISSLANDSTKEGKLCKLHFPQVSRLLLASAAWPFATRHVVLAALDGLATNPYTFAYPLPADFLHTQRIEMGLEVPRNDQMVSFRIEKHPNQDSLLLMTNWETPELKYTAEVAPQVWHPSFADAVTAELALRLARPLRANASLISELKAEAQMTLMEACHALSVDHEPPEPDSWFTSHWAFPSTFDVDPLSDDLG